MEQPQEQTSRKRAFPRPPQLQQNLLRDQLASTERPALELLDMMGPRLSQLSYIRPAQKRRRAVCMPATDTSVGLIWQDRVARESINEENIDKDNQSSR